MEIIFCRAFLCIRIHTKLSDWRALDRGNNLQTYVCLSHSTTLCLAKFQWQKWPFGLDKSTKKGYTKQMRTYVLWRFSHGSIATKAATSWGMEAPKTAALVHEVGSWTGLVFGK
jgi:hypothetical protein